MRCSVDSAAVSIYVTTTNSSDNRSISARGRLIQNERPGSSLFSKQHNFFLDDLHQFKVKISHQEFQYSKDKYRASISPLKLAKFHSRFDLALPHFAKFQLTSKKKMPPAQVVVTLAGQKDLKTIAESVQMLHVVAVAFLAKQKYLVNDLQRRLQL